LKIPSFALNSLYVGHFITDHTSDDNVSFFTMDFSYQNKSSQISDIYALDKYVFDIPPLFFDALESNTLCFSTPSFFTSDISDKSSSLPISFQMKLPFCHNSIFISPYQSSSPSSHSSWTSLLSSSLSILTSAILLFPRVFLTPFQSFIVSQLETSCSFFSSLNSIESFNILLNSGSSSSSSVNNPSFSLEKLFAILTDSCLSLSLIMKIFMNPLYIFLSRQTSSFYLPSFVNSDNSNSEVISLYSSQPFPTSSLIIEAACELHTKFINLVVLLSRNLGSILSMMMKSLLNSPPISSSSFSLSTYLPINPSSVRLYSLFIECSSLCLLCLNSLSSTVLTARMNADYENGNYSDNLNVNSQFSHSNNSANIVSSFDAPSVVYSLLDIPLCFLQLSSPLHSSLLNYLSSNQSSSSSSSPSSSFNHLSLACHLFSPLFSHSIYFFHSLCELHKHQSLFDIQIVNSFLLPTVVSLFSVSQSISSSSSYQNRNLSIPSNSQLTILLHPLYDFRHVLLLSLLNVVVLQSKLRPQGSSLSSSSFQNSTSFATASSLVPHKFIFQIPPQKKMEMLEYLLIPLFLPFDILWVYVHSFFIKVDNNNNLISSGNNNNANNALVVPSTLTVLIPPSQQLVQNTLNYKNQNSSKSDVLSILSSYLSPTSGYTQSFPFSPLSSSFSTPLMDSLYIFELLSALTCRESNTKSLVFNLFIAPRLLPLLSFTCFSFYSSQAFLLTPLLLTGLPRALSSVISCFSDEIKVNKVDVISNSVLWLSSCIGLIGSVDVSASHQQLPTTFPSSLSLAFPINPSLRNILVSNISPIIALLSIYSSFFEVVSRKSDELSHAALSLAIQCIEICIEYSTEDSIQQLFKQSSSFSSSSYNYNNDNAFNIKRKNSLSTSSILARDSFQLIHSILCGKNVNNIPSFLFRFIFYLFPAVLDVVVPNKCSNGRNSSGNIVSNLYNNSNNIGNFNSNVNNNNNNNINNFLIIPPPSPFVIKLICSKLKKLDSFLSIFSKNGVYFEEKIYERLLIVLICVILNEGADLEREDVISLIVDVMKGIYEHNKSLKENNYGTTNTNNQGFNNANNNFNNNYIANNNNNNSNANEWISSSSQYYDAEITDNSNNNNYSNIPINKELEQEILRYYNDEIIIKSIKRINVEQEEEGKEKGFIKKYRERIEIERRRNEVGGNSNNNNTPNSSSSSSSNSSTYYIPPSLDYPSVQRSLLALISDYRVEGK
jgi:hypothetical protein